MASLNPAQADAVRTLRGPLLVLAGAGTGKTRVVTLRVAELIRTGIRPDRILAVTFTNKAAAEMQERIREVLGRRAETRPEVSTFHSLCVRILRRHITRLGYPARFAICDRGDQEALARKVLREIKVGSELMRPGDLLSKISTWKSAAIRPSDALQVARSDKDHLAAVGYRRYQTELKASGAVDFDDLLLVTEDLFTQFDEVRRAEAGRFDHLLVDEYQDTNGSQYRIVRGLARDHRNLCVVGDDDQSIYGWRGAEVEHILRFGKDWPDAKVVRLEENYRSTGEIIAIANRLIAFNATRHDKILRASRPGGLRPQILQFKDENEEAKEIVALIQQRLRTPGIDPRDLAILFRTNEQPRPFEAELRKAKVPYTLVGGMSFFDRKEVRDVTALLRLIESDDDEVAFLRIVNTPPRGVGPKAVEVLMKSAVESSTPVWKLARDAQRRPTLPRAAEEGLDRLVKLVDGLRAQLGRRPLVDIANELLEKVEYRHEIDRSYDDPDERQTRWSSVEQVINSLAAHEKEAKKPSLGDFLDELALSGRDFDNDKEKKLAGNAVALMTLHSAKGLEFPEVYMVGLEEGILPHHRSVAAEGSAIDEERRLCYVGVTRAQERLTLSLSLTRFKWGKPRETIPSRFLFEIMGQAENAAKFARKARETLKQSGSTTIAKGDSAKGKGAKGKGSAAKGNGPKTKPQAGSPPTKPAPKRRSG